MHLYLLITLAKLLSKLGYFYCIYIYLLQYGFCFVSFSQYLANILFYINYVLET